MITRIQAQNYRCLRRVDQRLGAFHVLVGPNGSGKSTFLDVVRFLAQVIKEGPLEAVRERSGDPKTLMWMCEGSSFEVAVEADIPEERRGRLLPAQRSSRVRYEVSIGLTSSSQLAILGENLWLRGVDEAPQSRQDRWLFPAASPEFSESIVLAEGKHAPPGWRKVVSKKSGSGNDYFQAETTGWNNPFRLGPSKSALANLPEDEERFPVATWFKRILLEGIRPIVLNSDLMRRPSPSGGSPDFKEDGSNLPWVVAGLSQTNPERFGRWVAHIQTALPDLETVETVERPEDRSRYLQIRFRTGLKIPSWGVSDGTLRLLALTLLAYANGTGQVYLIEEPENGIQPTSVETVFQSLSSAYGKQILCASHSPVVLSCAKVDDLLCFAKTEHGATDVVLGSEHPALRDWQSGLDLGTLFAAGVLG